MNSINSTTRPTSPELSTVQNCADFMPSKSMYKWIDTVIEIGSMSPSRVSKASRVHRNTFYYWLTIPGFQNWFNFEISQWRESVLFELIEIGVEQAKKGNYKYWRSLMTYFGMLPPENK